MAYIVHQLFDPPLVAIVLLCVRRTSEGVWSALKLLSKFNV